MRAPTRDGPNGLGPGLPWLGETDRLSRRAADQRTRRRDPRRPPRPSGRDRCRRDGVGKEHPAAEDLPRSGTGRRRKADRAHPTPTPGRPYGRRAGRRGAGDPAGSRGGVHGAVHRPGRPHDPGEGHDRRDPPGRDPARPAIRPLRHPDHRRGPRAESQRRFPARVLHPAPAPAARSEADHHVGHHRHRTLRPPLRRPGHRGVGSDLPGRDALPAPRGRRQTARSGSARGHLRCRRGAAARRPGRHSGVLQWRTRDPRSGGSPG